MYVAIPDEYFHMDVYREVSSRNKRETKPLRGMYYLGSFMICCTQKMLHLNKAKKLQLNKPGNYRLAAQVANRGEAYSPIEFYMKNFFIEMEHDHKVVKTINKSIPRSTGVKDNSLVYVLIEIPLYLVHPWWVQRSPNSPYTVKYIIENGSKHILKYVKSHYEVAQKEFSKQLEALSTIIVSGCYKKGIKDSFRKK